MTQQEAIKALAGWFPAHKDVTWVRMEYLRLLSANVAAVATQWKQSGYEDMDRECYAQSVEDATFLTHATIQSLVTGAKEGGE